MKRKDFVEGLNNACSILERLELDDDLYINAALHGYLSTAIGCIQNALHHSLEYIDYDEKIKTH